MNEFETNNQENRNNSEQETAEENLTTEPEISEMDTTPEEKKPIGQIIGIIIIVVVIIIGGLYFYGKTLYKTSSTVDDKVTATEILEQPDEIVEALKQQSTSDEAVEIEKDLNLTNFDNFDAEFENIDAELGL